MKSSPYLKSLQGKKLEKDYLPKLIGESKHTWADISNANKLLDYNPKIYLREGLVEEIAYISSLYSLKK